ncbi:flagellar hook-associated protein 3 [Thermodesulfatator indicus DSM 15286]|uniref:Flagellar hook-associated protein 3 n=1 Tax=Thermodesulfatator indicus (strain DSM 15286 / JCM 11887 / CIR29812) TaxID=667014 RepID=F8AAR0_THEID|nr:flagellar hook-associated protein FlgL [Thermodesulfatator indicus]AEH44339.1 flagellar hook-associated protein 3 [Thermodesulfatator indicus DSM 15286]
MPLRVGMKTMYDSMLYQLNNLTESTRKLQTQIASGVKYEKPSDAPVDLVRALGYRKSLEEIDRYQTSIREGKAYLRTMEGAYQGLEDIVTRAKQLAIQARNSTMSPANREAIAKEVDSLLSEALALANTRHGNRYVFGGDKPTGYEDGHPPFELIKEALPNGEVKEYVVYRGGEEDMDFSYSPDGKLLIGRNGREAIMTSGIFDTLIGLKKTLEADNQSDPHRELEELGVHIDRLDKVLTHLTNERAALGARMDHLDLKSNLYDDLKTTIKENLSDAQDADLLEVATRLKAKETAYQAALAATAKVMNLSLVNYLS